MEPDTPTIYSDMASIRLTPEQKKAIEEAARKAKMSPSEWARKQMLESIEPAPEARRIMLVNAIASEILLLTLAAIQNQEDVSTDKNRQRIEREAITTAEATLNRWLSLSESQKGAV